MELNVPNVSHHSDCEERPRERRAARTGCSRMLASTERKFHTHSAPSPASCMPSTAERVSMTHWSKLKASAFDDARSRLEQELHRAPQDATCLRRLGMHIARSELEALMAAPAGAAYVAARERETRLAAVLLTRSLAQAGGGVRRSCRSR